MSIAQRLPADSVIRKFRMTVTDGKAYDTPHRFIAATNWLVLQDAGRVTEEIARAHAESEFEKYRIVQDRLYQSDFDRLLARPGEEKDTRPAEMVLRPAEKTGGSDAA